MDDIPSHTLIIITENDIKKIRELYGITDVNRIKESISAVGEWCQKQDHLSEAYKYLNFNILERFYILAKGSTEATKTRIDKYLTTKCMIPELALNWRIDEFDDMYASVMHIPLPNLCPIDQSRVIVSQFVAESTDKFTFLSYFRYCFMLEEYCLNFDKNASQRYILDMKNVGISFLSKLNPILLKKAEVMCTEGFGTRIKGIHILNAPTFVDQILNIFKQVFRDKVARRIFVHSTYDDLYKYIPKEILPKEHGGDEKSCSDLISQWRDLFNTTEARKIIADSNKRVSDESKRNICQFNEEYLGMPGSFRKLIVD